MHAGALRAQTRHVRLVGREVVDHHAATQHRAVHHASIAECNTYVGDTPIVTIGEEQEMARRVMRRCILVDSVGGSGLLPGIAR